MPNTFRYFFLSEFPATIRDKPYVVPNQLRIASEDAQDTVLTWNGSIEGPATSVGRVEIEHDLLVETHGRAIFRFDDGHAQLQPFSEYVTTSKLSGFLADDHKVLTIEGKGEVVNHVFRTLRDHADQICIAQGNIDFEKLSRFVGHFKGAWFSKVAGPISALGLFGQDVNGSAEWENAQLNSSIKSVMFQHMYDDQLRTLMITQDAGIVVYQDLPPDQMLDMVFEVQRDILIPSLDDPDFSKNRGTTRDNARTEHDR